jgi:hypothetical protein
LRCKAMRSVAGSAGGNSPEHCCYHISCCFTLGGGGLVAYCALEMLSSLPRDQVAVRRWHRRDYWSISSLNDV